jgi:predicted  nucleic acid-binding Zn-ribbon protein
MIEASNESMFVELQSIRACLAQVDGKIDELKYEVQASRTSQIALRQEITRIHQELSDIHATLVRHEGRLDRIERRLELTEVPTS